MKLILTSLLTMMVAVAAQGSILNEKANLEGFGNIAYRGPLVKNSNETVVLFQAVFGGTTHRHMGELRNLLDQAGFRVYTMDLPGTGESDSPKVITTQAELVKFVELFLAKVVKTPAIVVGEQLLGSAALEVSKTQPELFQRIVLISPSGVNFLKGPGNPAQTALFDKLWSNDADAKAWFQTVVTEDSAKYYLGKVYFDQNQVNEERIKDITLTSQFPEQTWATLSFVGGKMFADYATASKDVKVPVLAIFGAEPGSPVTGGTPEKMEQFEAIQPNFKYVQVEKSGNLPHKEQPQATFMAIATE